MKNKKHNDYISKLVICSLLFFIFGLISFYLGCSTQLSKITDNQNIITTWKNIFCSIGSVLIVSGIYNVIYEYSIRNSMFNVIRKELGIKDFIVSAGVDSIWLQLNKIPYESLFQSVKSEVDIVHSYGNSWNDANYDYIKDLLQHKSNITMRIILLSPKSKLISGLYELYRKDTEDELLSSMLKSINYWMELSDIAEKNGNTIKVYYHNQNPTHSLYRFDDTIVNVSNLITKTRTSKLPTIICKKNERYTETLYSNYYTEIEDIINNYAEEITKENYQTFFKKESNKG